ncbi:hypothetical protein ACKF11_13880 [Methylobacillus sp. Pita2]|uniref:hypothetical protein n=1 Tax=Methylobacillus sp. Pita2 TaxID=3383245 RepID=UPI0038B69CBB
MMLEAFPEFQITDWEGAQAEGPAELVGLPYTVLIEKGKELVTIKLSLPGYSGNMNFSIEIDKGLPTLRAYNEGDEPLAKLALSPTGVNVETFESGVTREFEIQSDPDLYAEYQLWLQARAKQLVAESAASEAPEQTLLASKPRM